MDKKEFRRRLDRASVRAREFAQGRVQEILPEVHRYLMPHYDDPRGSRGPAGTLKYFRGEVHPARGP